MGKTHNTTNELEAVVGPLLAESNDLVKETQTLIDQSNNDLQALNALLTAHDSSSQRLQDNQRIVQVLTDLLPPYVVKVRDVQTDFEDFEQKFPKSEETVRTLLARSKQTANDIETLRKQVESLTQRQAAFSGVFPFAPWIAILLIAVIWPKHRASTRELPVLNIWKPCAYLAAKKVV